MLTLRRIAFLVAHSPGILSAALFLQLVAPSQAEQSMNVQAGWYQGYQNLAIGWDTGQIWSHQGRSRQELLPEVSLGYAGYDGHVAASRKGLWHVGAQLFYRWYSAPRSFLEVGIGPNLFTRTFVGHRTFSTHFQFGDSLGFAHEISDRWTLGLRITHFSNAGIKRPNDGVTFVHLVASHSLGRREDR